MSAQTSSGRTDGVTTFDESDILDGMLDGFIGRGHHGRGRSRSYRFGWQLGMIESDRLSDAHRDDIAAHPSNDG